MLGRYVLPVCGRRRVFFYGMSGVFLRGDRTRQAYESESRDSNQISFNNKYEQVLIVSCAPGTKSAIYDCLVCSKFLSTDMLLILRSPRTLPNIGYKLALRVTTWRARCKEQIGSRNDFIITLSIAEIPRDHFPRSILVSDVFARMSRGCYEENTSVEF